MKTDFEVLQFIESLESHAATADALRAYIGDGADAKIADMRQRKLLRTVSTGFFESGKASYGLGPAASDHLQDKRSNAEQIKFTRRLAVASLIVSIIAIYLSGLSLLLRILE